MMSEQSTLEHCINQRQIDWDYLHNETAGEFVDSVKDRFRRIDYCHSSLGGGNAEADTFRIREKGEIEARVCASDLSRKSKASILYDIRNGFGASYLPPWGCALFGLAVPLVGLGLLSMVSQVVGGGVTAMHGGLFRTGATDVRDSISLRRFIDDLPNGFFRRASIIIGVELSLAVGFYFGAKWINKKNGMKPKEEIECPVVQQAKGF